MLLPDRMISSPAKTIPIQLFSGQLEIVLKLVGKRDNIYIYD